MGQCKNNLPFVAITDAQNTYGLIIKLKYDINGQMLKYILDIFCMLNSLHLYQSICLHIVKCSEIYL